MYGRWALDERSISVILCSVEYYRAAPCRAQSSQYPSTVLFDALSMELETEDWCWHVLMMFYFDFAPSVQFSVSSESSA